MLQIDPFCLLFVLTHNETGFQLAPLVNLLLWFKGPEFESCLHKKQTGIFAR